MDRKRRLTFDGRSSGLLMHITSLPGPHGSGDLGGEAYRFVDFLSAAGQTWWQMLPVAPPGAGGSPYSATSTQAGSPYLSRGLETTQQQVHSACVAAAERQEARE